MKKLLASAIIFSALTLAACGETETENVSGSVNKEESAADTTEEVATDEEAAKETEEAINEVVADNDKYKITLLNIVKKSDDIWGNEINVVYEVENKLAETIIVQSRSLSADGYMVDETIYNMSQEVVGGKKAKATLTISDFEGYDYPELNSDLEMTLITINGDSWDTIEEIPVKVSF